MRKEKANAQVQLLVLAPCSFTVAQSRSALFESVDILSNQSVLSPCSRNTIGEAEVALFNASSILASISRGPLISEDALLEVLAGGKIRCVALDSFWIEALPEASRPHLA